MKKIALLFSLLSCIFIFSQGRSISLKKKSTTPVFIENDSIKVGDVIFFKIGTNLDGSFKFSQDLNNFNEPIRQSGSKISMMKQPIKFFKEADGVVYGFTKYFVVNLGAAILSKEVEIIKEK